MTVEITIAPDPTADRPQFRWAIAEVCDGELTPIASGTADTHDDARRKVGEVTRGLEPNDPGRRVGGLAPRPLG